MCYAGDEVPAKEGHLNGQVMLFCVVVQVSNYFLLNQARAHSWPTARAWFTEIISRKVCVCTYLPIFVRMH